jgi:hypothetical protein
MDNVTELRPGARTTPEKPARSTAPMDCINDVSCTIEQVKAVLECVTDRIESETDDSAITGSMYAMLALLKGAADRCAEARGPSAED